MANKLTEEQQEELQEVLAKCYNDSAHMAKLLFHESFRAPFTDLHYKYFDFLDNCECPRKGVIAPRGFIKTTGNKFYIKKRLLFQDKKFIGYLTNSGDIAVSISDSIKADLLQNTYIRKIFGDVKSSKSGSSGDEKWAEKSWIAHVGGGSSMVLPRGQSQQVNGLIWKDWRPDLWVIDDLEDRVEVRTAEQRKKVRNWFFGVLLYSFSQYESEADDQELIYSDTIKHRDALMCHLMDDPDWEVLNLPVCDKSYHTLAPAFKSQETLDKEVASHRERGTLDIFAMEQMGQTQSEEMKSFHPSMVKYYNENDEDFVNGPRKRLINVVIWDPAKTVNPKSAETGFTVWGLDLEYNAFYARLCIGERLTVPEQQDKAIWLVETFNAQSLGIEVTSLEDHILYPFINECQRKKKYHIPPKILKLQARAGKGEMKGEEGGKEGRISLLVPYYIRGLIWHDRVGAARLEQQLLGSRLRDVADSAAYLPKMLMEAHKFMQPTTVDAEPDTFAEEQAYRELEDEPPMKRNVYI